MSNAPEKQRKALGKGLASLLPSKSVPPASEAATATAPAPVPARVEPLAKLPIDSISPNPVQPRVVFQAERLEELAASIRANGILQPLIVRHYDGQYQLVAGERRWRAAKLAGLSEVPVVVQDIADPAMLELALVENVQREDLNVIETAHAYDRLCRELGLSQEEVARRVGKDRASIANTIRLLKLPESVQLLLSERKLSMGHARAILGLPDPRKQIEISERAVAQGLSVRQVESIVQGLTAERQESSKKKPPTQDPNVKAAVEELERALGTRVRITEISEQRGRIEIEYYSQAELDRLYQLLVSSGG
jgi:ParB family chromosome partitioning protein